MTERSLFLSLSLSRRLSLSLSVLFSLPLLLNILYLMGYHIRYFAMTYMLIVCLYSSIFLKQFLMCTTLTGSNACFNPQVGIPLPPCPLLWGTRPDDLFWFLMPATSWAHHPTKLSESLRITWGCIMMDLGDPTRPQHAKKNSLHAHDGDSTAGCRSAGYRWSEAVAVALWSGYIVV